MYHAYAVVALVGHQHVPLAIHGNTCWVVELRNAVWAVAAARCTAARQRGHNVGALLNLTNAVVVSVGHKNVARRRVHRHPVRRIQLCRATTTLATAARVTTE